MATIAPFVFWQSLDNNGDPLDGGKIYTYEAGTTTPKGTFTDATGGTPNANPIVLDSNGRADIWLDTGAYRFIIKTSADVTVDDVDNITGETANVFGSSVETVAVNTNITTAFENTVIEVTAAVTLSLLDVATATEGFLFTVKNTAASGSVTIDPDGTEQIDGAATIAIPRGKAAMIICDGTGWLSLYINELAKTDYAAGTVVAADSFLFFDANDSDDPKIGDVQDLIDTLEDPGLVFLGSYSASVDASVDIGSGLDLDAAIDSTYNEYQLHFTDVLPATDLAELNLRTSTDGGVSFDSGASDYRYALAGLESGSATVSVQQSATDTKIEICEGVGSGAAEGASGVLYLFAPSSTTNTNIMVQTTWYQGQDRVKSYHGGGQRVSAADVDALRVLFSTGNISSGEFKLYGVRKT